MGKKPYKNHFIRDTGIRITPLELLVGETKHLIKNSNSEVFIVGKIMHLLYNEGNPHHQIEIIKNNGVGLNSKLDEDKLHGTLSTFLRLVKEVLDYSHKIQQENESYL